MQLWLLNRIHITALKAGTHEVRQNRMEPAELSLNFVC
jgi:hypothetical protein